jgi:hypothetical protein
MPPRTRLIRALTLLLPAGACGASVLLALSASPARAQPDASLQQEASGSSVAERLRVIRAGVAELSQSAPGSAEPEAGRGARGTPTSWANGPGWANGPNWSNGPAAWGNGPGWGNGGWPNWGNGWHNWGNGWHNGWRWHNWHNFWHNW